MEIFLSTILYLAIVVCTMVAVLIVVALTEFLRVIVTTFVKRVVALTEFLRVIVTTFVKRKKLA